MTSSSSSVRQHTLASLVSLLLGATLGCSGGERPRGPELPIAVAPLTLEGVKDACYSLTVDNAAGQRVWSADHLCASQYGNGAGGAISYIGTCDATDPGTGAWNTVTLKIDGLYGAVASGTPVPADLGGWVDPCALPYADGCELRTLCVENADAPVTFNLTIMRDAKQGFFDVAVNFEDIFCSAKVDCTDPLVFDPITGDRVDSVVLGFACTDGDPGATSATATHLYMNDLVIRCGDDEYPIDPSAGPGNMYPGGVGAPDPVVQAMSFVGVEQITNQGAPADKLFWNVAFGIDVAWFDDLGDATTCTLTTRATASHGPLSNGLTPPNTLYPYVDVDVTLFAGGAWVCSEHPLNGVAPHGGVATTYTAPLPDRTGFGSVPFTNQGVNTGGTLATSHVEGYVDPCLALTCGDNAHCDAGTVTCVCNGGYSGDPCVLDAECGNGLPEAGEDCDLGDANGDLDCAYGDTSCTRCTSTCNATEGAPHLCGDGTREPEETCDDGAFNGDPNMCASDCMGQTPPSCGNGAMEAGESCDDGIFNGDVGFCDDLCMGLTQPTCGDGIPEGSEMCDRGGDNGTVTDCAYGLASCDVCTSECNLVPGITHTCGDTTQDPEETCDAGPMNGMTPCGCQFNCEYATLGLSCGGNNLSACDLDDQCDGAGGCERRVASAGTPCRNALNIECDEPEVCNGVADECPPDLAKPVGTVCSMGPMANACEAESTCQGTEGSTSQCVRNYLGPEVTCAIATQLCETDAHCTGDSFFCPMTGYADNTTICRPAFDQCDAPDFCDGVTHGCNGPDNDQPDGFACTSCAGSSCACDDGACIDPCAGFTAIPNVTTCSSNGLACTCECDADYTWTGVACQGEGEWQPEQAASAVNVETIGSQTWGAVDAVGNALVLWYDVPPRLMARRYDAINDSWGDTEQIAEDAFQVQFEVAPNTGDGVVAWEDRSGNVKVVTYDGGFGSIETVATCDAGRNVESLALDLAPTGDGIILYGCGEPNLKQLFSVRVSANLVFYPAQLVTTNSNASQGSVAVAVVGNQLRASAAWMQRNGARNDVATSQLLVELQSGAGEWPANGTVLNVGSNFNIYARVARSAGREVVIWEQNSFIQAVERYTGGAWSTPVQVDAHLTNDPPHVGMDAAGNAMISLSAGADGIYARPWTTGGFGVGVRVAAVGSLGSDLVMSVAPNGNATVGWGDATTGATSLYVADYSAAHGWEAPSLIEHDDDPDYGSWLFVSRGVNGHGIATWTRFHDECLFYDSEFPDECAQFAPTAVTVFASLRQ